MWSHLLILLVLSCSMARSQSKDDEEKALEWLTQLYAKQANEKKDQTIDNRFVDTSKTSPNLTPISKDKNKHRACDTQTKENGICTKRSKCSKEAPKLDPTTSFILREKDPCHYLEVCCPVSQVRATPKKAEPARQEGCGYSHPGAGVFREKATKSGYADYGEFPWMVALLKAGEYGWKDENAIGGGTIIHPCVVMTAAHKVSELQPQDLKCRAGEWDTQTENEVYPHQERSVQKIITHEDYFSAHQHYDIALLTLKEPFDMQPHVGVACLSQALPPPGTECYGMGWGQDFTRGNMYANVLKKITLPLVGHDDCENRYRRSRLGSGYTLHRSLTCAGGEALVDTCLGDGGASLVCPVGSPSDVRYAVVGMVVYGLECGTANIPGVYVNVPELYDWVGRQMTLEGFNRTAYEPGLDASFKLKEKD